MHDNEVQKDDRRQNKKKRERHAHKSEHARKLRIGKDVSEAVQKGDLSENAEYQEAKARLSRIDGRIFSLKERIKNAIPIVEGEATGRVQLGSTVTLRVNERERSYRVVGPSETNPSQGRISHLSPLGVALIDRAVGESVSVNGVDYLISAILP